MTFMYETWAVYSWEEKKQWDSSTWEFSHCIHQYIFEKKVSHFYVIYLLILFHDFQIQPTS